MNTGNQKMKVGVSGEQTTGNRIMNMKNNMSNDVETEGEWNETRVVEVGKPYPGDIPYFYGSTIRITSTFEMLTRMNNITEKEIQAFQNMTGYGLYQSKDLPHGLLIWRFNDDLFCETPFNPRKEEYARPKEVHSFLQGDFNACQCVLIDERGIVRALGVMWMDLGFVETLRNLWSDPNLDWSDYDDQYIELTNKKTQAQLWRKAQKCAITPVRSFDDQPEQNVAQPQTPYCKNCVESESVAASLRKALKQAKETEADLRQQVQNVNLKLAEVSKVKTELEQKVATLSENALQQEIIRLTTLIEEKGFEIELLNEGTEKCHNNTSKLQAHISDLERHNRYFETLLRQHGVAFTSVCGHGAGHNQ